MVAAFAGLLHRSLMARQQAAAIVHQQREWLHVTLASIGDAVIATDIDGRVVFLNSVAADLTGWTQEEAANVPLDTVFPIINEETRHATESPVVKALREGTVVGMANHTVLIAKDGTERPIDDSAAPIRSLDGKVLGVVLVFRDASEKRLHEIDLRNRAQRERLLLTEAATANAKFRAFFEQGPLFAGIMALDGTLLEPNRLSLEACGYTREQVVGKPFWDCPWWSPSPPLVQQIKDASARAAAGETFHAELSYFVADGSQRMVDFVLLPIKDEDGNVLFLAPTGSDITRRRQLENELRQSAADLSAADRRKNEFLAVLAHELRNPLAPISNALELMRLQEADTVDDQTRTLRGMMERQVRQMTHLVDDLLDVSRITSGKIALRKQRLNVAEVVNSAVETSRPLLQAARHELTVTLPSFALFIEGDMTRLAQVLANLLANSAKYTPEGGHIWVTAHREGHDAVIRVRDNGMGIPTDMLPQVFEMFAQVDRNLGRSQGGLGIGLTLVRSFVEMHGGNIEARSDGPGRGSEFIVRLQLVDDQPPPDNIAAQDGQQQPAANTAARRILIVDDNRDSADTLGRLLQVMGNEVRIVHDGPTALEVAASFLPHMALLDIGLPGISGYDVAQRCATFPNCAMRSSSRKRAGDKKRTSVARKRPASTPI